METGTEAAAPPGFISFCIRNPDQCSDTPEQVATVSLAKSTWSSIVAVNDHFNQTISPESDLEHYGLPEYWAIPQDGKGDCDDYAVAKRKALIDAGFPEGALRIAVVRASNGDRHAVLTISTDKGDYVLDNLGPRVMAWAKTNYVWLERQDPSRPWGWLAIKDN